MKHKNTETAFDQICIVPGDATDSYQFYLSFKKAKSLVDRIPKKLGGQSIDVFQKVLSSVHQSNMRGGALFRRRDDADEALAVLWLSSVKEISSIFIATNTVKKFEGLTPEDLGGIAKLAKDVNGLKRLQEVLMSFGIVLVYERALPGMKMDGAVFVSESGHPVVGMSLRYARFDMFWFTLMHELAHIALHFEVLAEPILDDLDMAPEGLVEKQANKLASESLISRSQWRNAGVKYDMKESQLLDFANKVGVHPSIVAGRLQYETKRYDLFADIVNSVDVRGILLENE